jgi:hypothetical protein
MKSSPISKNKGGVAIEFDALGELKNMLALEYGISIDKNRLINKRRESMRMYAGIAMIFSIMSTVILAALLAHSNCIGPA